MKNTNTINKDYLTAGGQFLVRGNVGFCRIARQTTDREREEVNARRERKQTGNFPTLSIYNAQVLARDPQNPSFEEQCGAKSMYLSSCADFPGNNFCAFNTTAVLPGVSMCSKDGRYHDVVLTSELPQGLDVTIVMRVSEKEGKTDMNIERVLINEPISAKH